MGGGGGALAGAAHCAAGRAGLRARARARPPPLTCVIGCMPLGRLLMSGATCAGSLERACSSAVTDAACAAVGTSPVISSQSRPSGVGSPPGTVGGSFF